MKPMQGREVVIVEAVRTPVGRGHLEKGYYKDMHPTTLLAASTGRYRALRGRPAEAGDVVAGCVQQFGEQAFNIGRNAWLRPGCRWRRRRRRSTASAGRPSRPSTSRRR